MLFEGTQHWLSHRFIHSIVSSCVTLYFILLYCIIFYCSVMYCLVLYSIVLYCIVLYEPIPASTSAIIPTNQRVTVGGGTATIQRAEAEAIKGITDGGRTGDNTAGRNQSYTSQVRFTCPPRSAHHRATSPPDDADFIGSSAYI